MLSRVFAMFLSIAFVAALPAPAQALDKAERACAASKLKATGKKAAAKFKCEAKAIAKELAVADPECVAKVEEVFDKAFVKAEEKGGCVSDGDAAAVESNVDELVQEEVTRQKTGAGVFPSCASPGTTCGSCGSGMCIPHATMGLVCVLTAGVVPAGCTTDAQCAAGQICLQPTVPACVSPCP